MNSIERLVALVIAPLACSSIMLASPANAATCINSQVCLQTTNGNVLQHPKIYLVYWGWGFADPNGEKAILEGFLGGGVNSSNIVLGGGIGGSRWAQGIAEEYNGWNWAGSHYDFAGGMTTNLLQEVTYDNSAPPSHAADAYGYTGPTPAEVGAEALTIAQGLGVDGDENTIMWIAFRSGSPFPDNLSVSPTTTINRACAYHGDVANTGGNPPVTFVMFPYVADVNHLTPDPIGTNGVCSCTTANCAGSGNAADSDLNTITAIASHELIETITDPRVNSGDPFGYFDNAQQEIGDKCQYVTPATSVSVKANSGAATYGIPRTWGNGSGNNGTCEFSHFPFLEKQAFEVGTDGHLYREYSPDPLTPLAWQDWTLPSGVSLASDPTAASWGPGRQDAFVRASDNTIRHAVNTLTGSAPWSTWDNWGSPGSPYTLTGSPDVTSWGYGRLDLFSTATDSSGKAYLFHRWWDNGTFGSWENVGNLLCTSPCISRPILSGPGVASWGYGRLDMFVLVQNSLFDSTPHMGHAWWTGSAWAWEDRGAPSGGAVMVGDPDVSAWAPGRLDVFTLASGGATFAHYYYQGGWGYDLWNGPSGKTLRPNVSSTGLGDGRFLLSAIDTSDNSQWQIIWDYGLGSWYNNGGATYGSLDLTAGP